MIRLSITNKKLEQTSKEQECSQILGNFKKIHIYLKIKKIYLNLLTHLPLKTIICLLLPT